MAKARTTVRGRGGVSPASSSVAQTTVGGVAATPPPLLAQDAVEDDDLCDCGHPSMPFHPGAAACSKKSGCGCVGLRPR